MNNIKSLLNCLPIKDNNSLILNNIPCYEIGEMMYINELNKSNINNYYISFINNNYILNNETDNTINIWVMFQNKIYKSNENSILIPFSNVFDNTLDNKKLYLNNINITTNGTVFLSNDKLYIIISDNLIKEIQLS